MYAQVASWIHGGMAGIRSARGEGPEPCHPTHTPYPPSRLPTLPTVRRGDVRGGRVHSGWGASNWEVVRAAQVAPASPQREAQREELVSTRGMTDTGKGCCRRSAWLLTSEGIYGRGAGYGPARGSYASAAARAPAAAARSLASSCETLHSSTDVPSPPPARSLPAWMPPAGELLWAGAGAGGAEAATLSRAYASDEAA